MTQQLLEAFNSEPYAWEKVEKNGMMDIVYSFTDEQDHSYRYHFEKRVNYGRNVFVVTLGQKAPSLKMYKRVFGKFANPLRVIATLIEVVKDVKTTRKDVKGIILEVPEQAFGAHGRLVDRILKRELRTELNVEDMEFNAEEFETLGLKGTVATLKPNRFKQVFTGKLMQDILAKREADGKGYSSATDSDSPVVQPVVEPVKQGFQPKQSVVSEKIEAEIKIEAPENYISIAIDAKYAGTVQKSCNEVFSGFEKFKRDSIRYNGKYCIVEFVYPTKPTEIIPYVKSLVVNLKTKGIDSTLVGNILKKSSIGGVANTTQIGKTQIQIDVKYDGNYQGGKSYQIGLIGLKKNDESEIADILDEYDFTFEGSSSIRHLFSYPADKADKLDSDLADAISRINRFTDYSASVREKLISITHIVKYQERATACFSIEEEMWVAYFAMLKAGYEDVATLNGTGQGEDKYRIIDTSGKLSTQEFANILEPLIGKAFRVDSEPSIPKFKYELLTDERYDIRLRFDTDENAKQAYGILQGAVALQYGNDYMRLYANSISSLKANVTGREMDRKVARIIELLGEPTVDLENQPGTDNLPSDHQTKDGYKFQVDGRKLTFKADINFNSIMDYVFGWFKSEFDTIDGKRQFVDKTNGENLTQNFIGVLEKLSIKEAITKKVAEQFDTIISKTHREYDLSTTMYERSIGAPAGQISDYREFKGEVVVNDSGTAFAVFTSNAGPFVKSAREQFGSADFEVNGNLNTLKVPLDGNFSIKEFDAGLVGKFLKAHDDNYGVLSTRFYPVKIIKSGKVTYQSERQYATISLNQDFACYLSGLENYDQNSKTSSTVSFEGVETLSDFYDLCDKLSDYDFEGNYLKAFRFSKYINDAKANGGKLEITKGEKSVKVEIQEDMIFINLTGMSLPEISMPLWKKGETSVFLRTYYLGHKKFNDVLVVLDNFLDKELSEATTSEVAGADITVEQKFHFEHQKGGFKVVTDSDLASVKALMPELDITDNGDGSLYVKLSHFSQTTKTKNALSGALVSAGFKEGEHVATPGSAAASKTSLPDNAAPDANLTYDVMLKDVVPNKFYIMKSLKDVYMAVKKYGHGVEMMNTATKQVIFFETDVEFQSKPTCKLVDDPSKKSEPTSINWSTADTALKGQYFKDSNYKVVNMKVDELISRQATDFRIDAGSDKNRIKGRAERALAHITSGAPMDMPVVDIDAQGNLQVVDGRHRIAVAKEMGLKEIPVFLHDASNKSSSDVSKKPKLNIFNDLTIKLAKNGSLPQKTINVKGDDVFITKLSQSGMYNTEERNLSFLMDSNPLYTSIDNQNAEVKRRLLQLVGSSAERIKSAIESWTDGRIKVDSVSGPGVKSEPKTDLSFFLNKEISAEAAEPILKYLKKNIKVGTKKYELNSESGVNYLNKILNRLVSLIPNSTDRSFSIGGNINARKAGGLKVVVNDMHRGGYYDGNTHLAVAVQVGGAYTYGINSAVCKFLKEVFANLTNIGDSLPEGRVFDKHGTNFSTVGVAYTGKSYYSNPAFAKVAITSQYLNLSEMNESIKEDLTGVAPKVNKVEKSLLESAMRSMGIYHSFFGYGGAAFTTTINEGVVDILPTQGNIDHLQKMLGVKLGHELVKDARGGLCFDIS